MSRENTGSYRSIQIKNNALGNVLISGDGNVVNATIRVVHQATEKLSLDESAALTKLNGNPYKGLASFREADANYYFGREEQVDRLKQKFQHLVQQPNSLRVLPVLGPSGCGKSSLIRAGLIPELVKSPLPGKENLRMAVLVPGSHPLEALAGVLAKTITNDPLPVKKTKELKDVLGEVNGANEYDGLRRIASLIPDIQETPLVILVDQFEEVYSLQRDREAIMQTDQQLAFINTLLHAAEDPSGNVSVLITLRSDFIGETQRHQKLNQVICSSQSMIVPAMKMDELHRAIAEPAKLAGHPLDVTTVNLLVKQAHDREGALPLLQFALARIWEGLREGIDPEETLHEIGGIGGALANRAQDIYDQLSEVEQAIAQMIFVSLVELSDPNHNTRRPVEIKRLATTRHGPEEIKSVIRKFAAPEFRLITLSNRDGREIAEVTHEAIFKHWGKIQIWLSDGLEDIRLQRKLEEATEHWNRFERPDGLLWRNPDLSRLEDFIARRGTASLNKGQIYFYKASTKVEKRRQRNRKLTRLAFLTLAAAIASLSLFSWRRAYNDWRRLESIFLGQLNSEDTTNALPFLKKEADRLMQTIERQFEHGDANPSIYSRKKYEAELERLFAYYRSILLTIGRLEDEEAKSVQYIAQEVEDDWANIINKYRLSELKHQLENSQIGEHLMHPEPEFRYSPGALRTTYEILMYTSGVGADINRDSFISNEEEASLIPCEVLQHIEDLWRQFTEGKCGWYSPDGHHVEDADCQVLDINRSTLYSSIFDSIDPYTIERIKACGIQPM